MQNAKATAIQPCPNCKPAKLRLVTDELATMPAPAVSSEPCQACDPDGCSSAHCEACRGTRRQPVAA